MTQKRHAATQKTGVGDNRRPFSFSLRHAKPPSRRDPADQGVDKWSWVSCRMSQTGCKCPARAF